MELPRFVDPRSSFAAKVAVALLGTVGLLMAVMFLVVRSETQGQIRFVTDQAVQRAAQAFEESEQRRRQQLARRAEVFIDSRRTLALLEGAIDAGDIPDELVGELVYNLDLAGFEDSTTLAVLTDPDADPVITLLGLEPTSEINAQAITPLTRALLDQFATELTGYRLVNGKIYTVRSVALVLSGRLIGTAAFGLPIQDEDAAALGRVVQAEVCFVADDECVAGTDVGRTTLASALTSLPEGHSRVLHERDGQRWELVAEPLQAEGPAEGQFTMAIPLEPVVAPFDRIRRSLVLGSVGALLLALLLAVAISRGLTRPVRTLVDATRQVGRGDYDIRVPEGADDEMGQLARSFNTMTEGLALKEQYRGVLDKVVSRDVAEELLRGDVRLGGENREVTILFADVRGFTGLTEGMPPQEVIGLLNETMERLSTVIDELDGVVDKYIGDEVMAVFGAPLPQPDHVARAVEAAGLMQQAMRAGNRRRREEGNPPVEVGIGLHCGEVVAGNMGSANRLNYTVVGEAVNLAARLCAIAGPGQVLMSGAVRERLPDGVGARSVGVRELKGFSESVEVHELSDAAPARSGSGGHRTVSGVLLAALAAAGLASAGLVGPRPAAAQSLPTLSDLGLEWISSDGTFQAGLSGRLDLEGYVPTGDDEPWIIPTTDPFFAGRARLFGDLFVGSKLFVSTELRVDRSEEPRPGPWEARFDQAFVRAGPVAGAFVQVGKFVSPFAGYPQRHHTPDDPFIRPPLHYEYRTMVSASEIPANSAAFVDWKDEPETFRHVGAPPVWGAPYQWGAMVLGRAGDVDYKAAVMNSAPSSEPEEWGWMANPMDRPSVVLGVGYRPAPWLRLDAHYNNGPYLEDRPLGPFPADSTVEDYGQILWWGRALVELGRTQVRVEALHDRWEVPNVPDDPVDFSVSVEARQRLAAGLFVAGRYGSILFNRIDPSGVGYTGTQSGPLARWDYNAHRFQVGAGYRLVENAEIRAEYAMNWTDSPIEGDAGLLSVQLWWQY